MKLSVGLEINSNIVHIADLLVYVKSAGSLLTNEDAVSSKKLLPVPNSKYASYLDLIMNTKAYLIDYLIHFSHLGI